MARSTQDIRIVELHPIRSGKVLPDFVAATLGLPEKAGETALSAIVAEIERRRFVLVLDNCEHLAEECSVLVGELLRRCRKLHVVVTSREPLSVPGEVVVRLGPLPTDVAVRLFTERAGLTELTEHERAVISRICENVEGLPLAVELAARRARATCVREVAVGLSDLLHHDLAATIEWSYQLLSDAERTVLRRVSLLVNGFSLNAATAISSVSPDETLPILLRLAAKSLIERTGSADDSIRFRMPEPIRVFAREKLRAAGEELGVWHRTLDWLVGLTPPLLNEVHTPGGLNRTLDAERDNLFAATQWMSATGERPDDRVLLSAALARSLQLFGRVTASLHMLEQVLAEVPDSPYLAVALIPLSWGLCNTGRRTAAVEVAARAVRLAGEHGHLVVQLRALNQVGCALIGEGRFVTGEAVYRRAIRLAKPLSPMAVAMLRHNCAWLLSSAGDHERAAELLELALPVYREHLPDRDLAHPLHTAAAVDLGLGRFAEAREWLLETLRVAGDNRMAFPNVVEGLGYIAEHEGDPRRALVLFAAADAFRTRMQRVHATGWGKRIQDSAARAQAQVSRKDCLAAQRRGRRMSEDALRAYLVADTGDRTLTTRELEVVRCLADGDGNQEIARNLGMAARTVSSHLERVKEKLGIYDRTSLQQWYLVEHG
ncbi:hypothetical protein Lesp02_08310 [Lentzea sp. NBRC 105346]|nr:hypothetical protein Lesp02_08310 [Lentzea sp. NBRC 105346]